MSRESKLVKNTFIIAIGTFLPKLASFIILPILTGCLTKEEYGTYDLLMVLVSLLLPAVTLQIQAAAFRFLLDVRNNPDEIKRIVTNIFCFIGSTSIVALAILFFVLNKQTMIVRVFICLYFYVDIYVNAARQICRGLGKYKDYSISAIVSALGKIVFTIVLVYWLKAGLIGTTISLSIASSISLIYLIIKVKLFKYVDFRLINKNTLVEMLKYSWPIVPNSMSAWVIRVSDRLVVTAVMGLAANAIYAVANKLPSLLTLVQSTFTMAWQENASIASDDKDASQYYTKMFATIYDVMAGCFGVLIAGSPILFKMLIRGDYLEAYSHIPILFLAMFFYSQSAFLGGIYVAYKKTKSVGISTFAAAVCNLIVDVGLINYIGLYAASGSTLISYFLLFIFRVIHIRKFVQIECNIPHMAIVFVVLLFETVLSHNNTTISNYINVVIGVVSFIILNKHVLIIAIRKMKNQVRRFVR